VTIFIHIGMPKSGSSSIQRTLKINQRLMLKHGVSCTYGSNCLYDLAIDDGAPPPEIPTDCHTAIVSDERLFHRVSNELEARRIVETLRRFSRDIKVICYIRREDEVFVSSYFTLLLSGSTATLEDRPLKPVLIYKRLQTWVSVLGADQIILRRFGPDYLPQGVVADFLANVGLDSIGIEEASRANVSPRTDVLEMIRQINAICPEPDRFALKLISAIEGAGERPGLSAEKRSKIVALAKGDTAKLSKVFFGGEPVFTHPFPDDATAQVELSSADVARVGKQLAKAHRMETGTVPTDTQESLRWLYALASDRMMAKRSAKLLRNKRASRN
jgi:hypothetical protein